jgi:uncharacterized membrane protein
MVMKPVTTLIAITRATKLVTMVIGQQIVNRSGMMKELRRLLTSRLCSMISMVRLCRIIWSSFIALRSTAAELTTEFPLPQQQKQCRR